MGKTRYRIKTYKKNRRNNKTQKNIKNHVIVGVVHAKWCGHCQVLMPKWRVFKNQLKNNKQITIIDIEDADPKKDSQIADLNLKINDKSVTIQANGFPTIFKIKNGILEYYSGNRDSNSLKKWALEKNVKPLESDAAEEPTIKSNGFFNLF